MKKSRLVRDYRIWLTFSLIQAGLLALEPFNPPAGSFIQPERSEIDQAPRFESGQPLVVTPYFYWYDVWSQIHMINSDGSDALTTHPPTLTGFSYKSVAWHKKQLRDMMEAGIDVLLPVYWGAPSELDTQGLDHWSYAGLPPLVKARDELLSEGLNPPAIGMFYDTSTLEYNAWNQQQDLTKPEGRQWFFESVRDFFSLLPARHWALVDDKALVFLYSSTFARAHDQSVIDFTSDQFRSTFSGIDLYIVREVSWNVQSDAVYAWGGALGLRNPGVGSLGPGYDHSAVPGRDPLVVDREGGAFFERNWVRFLRTGSWMAFIETWNEFHEGTDIAHSLEYGRHYIELNGFYVDQFRKGQIPEWPEGPFSSVDNVFIDFDLPEEKGGLSYFEWPDGKSTGMEVKGKRGLETVGTEYLGRYLYFKADDSFKWVGQRDMTLEVTYLDRPGLSFAVQYDGSDLDAPFQGAYTQAVGVVRGSGTGEWKTVIFQLPGARFLNSQNGGGDFRMIEMSGHLAVTRVLLRNPEEPKDDPQTQPHTLLWERSGRGEITWTIRGPEGYRYVLERSFDLLHWTGIDSIRITTGEAEFEKGISHVHPLAFFRAVRVN